MQVVLDRTPFYAEMGGQTGDRGLIDCDAAQFIVTSTVSKGGLYVHEGQLYGTLSEGDVVFAGYDLRLAGARSSQPYRYAPARRSAQGGSRRPR